MANNIAGVKRILPLHKVVNQLNTLIADGTAINKVNNTNTEPNNGFNPVTNIWCAQTKKAKIAIANNDLILVDPARVREETSMVGHHGGVTDIEVEIPLLLA